MPEVEMTVTAREQFGDLPKTMKLRVQKRIAWLRENWPDSRGKPLKGGLAGTESLRTGDYRILYEFDAETITITRIGNRKDVYDDGN